MDDRVIDILAALCVAAIAAVIAWFVAHCVFGISSPDIRISALMGAAIPRYRRGRRECRPTER